MGRKITITATVAALLIGILTVWAFTRPPAPQRWYASVRLKSGSTSNLQAILMQAAKRPFIAEVAKAAGVDASRVLESDARWPQNALVGEVRVWATDQATAERLAPALIQALRQKYGGSAETGLQVIALSPAIRYRSRLERMLSVK